MVKDRLSPPVQELFFIDESSLIRFATWFSAFLQVDDIIFLQGDLGSGKTCFARAVIRGLIGQDTQVTSPTFTLVQQYTAPRFEIFHADLYRLNTLEEVQELALFEQDIPHILLIEWAERLENDFPVTPIVVNLQERGMGRHLSLSFPNERLDKLSSALKEYLERDAELTSFLQKHDWHNAQRIQIAGDASGRIYERLKKDNKETAILMNWPALPDLIKHDYATKVHLGQNTASFTKITHFLRQCGLSAPKLLGESNKDGFLLLENFGTNSLTKFIDEQDQRLPCFYHESIEVLAHLHSCPPPNDLLRYDENVLHYELEVFLDYYITSKGITVTQDQKQSWKNIWDTLFSKLQQSTKVLVLRDFHSPNLHWLEEKQSLHRVGILDVQDALIGNPAYDTVSLLQDARRDVQKDLGEHLISIYLEKTQCDEKQFRTDFAILGTQRNLRILGVFIRLSQANKPAYLIHLPRVLSYINENLRHPALYEIKTWLNKLLPQEFSNE